MSEVAPSIQSRLEEIVFRVWDLKSRRRAADFGTNMKEGSEGAFKVPDSSELGNPKGV